MKKKDLPDSAGLTMHIKQLSKLTDVPYETLRHWTKDGYIRRVKNSDSGYYEYDISSSFCDVILIKTLRNIGFSFEMIEKYFQWKPNIITRMHELSEERIFKQIEQLNKSLEQIKLLKGLYKQASEYSEEIIEKEPPFSAIYKFDIKNPNIRLRDPWDCISLFSVENYELNVIDYAYVAHEKSEKVKLLWRKKAEATYLNFMLSNNSVTHDYQDRILKALKTIREIGLEPKYLFLKYVFTLNKPDTEKETYINYFDTWVEAYPIKE